MRKRLGTVDGRLSTTRICVRTMGPDEAIVVVLVSTRAIQKRAQYIEIMATIAINLCIVGSDMRSIKSQGVDALVASRKDQGYNRGSMILARHVSLP